MANDTSLRNYARLLQQWIHAFIASLDNNHPSNYVFPSTNQQKKLAQDLQHNLSTDQHDLSILHNLIKSILLVQSSQHHCSKWDSLSECMLAISALKSDGNFKLPHEITQTFAQLAYLIRSTILYEAMDNLATFDNNSYK